MLHNWISISYIFQISWVPSTKIGRKNKFVSYTVLSADQYLYLIAYFEKYMIHRHSMFSQHTVVHPWRKGLCSGKCVVRRFHHRMKLIGRLAHTHLDGTASCARGLYGISPSYRQFVIEQNVMTRSMTVVKILPHSLWCSPLNSPRV